MNIVIVFTIIGFFLFFLESVNLGWVGYGFVGMIIIATILAVVEDPIKEYYKRHAH